MADPAHRLGAGAVAPSAKSGLPGAVADGEDNGADHLLPVRGNRQSTVRGFHDAMSRCNNRLAFATITKR